MHSRRLLARIRSGAVRNIRFKDLVGLLEALGFRHDRTRGSHHIYVHPRIPVLLSLQPDGDDAKIYQVRQVVRLIEEYNLAEDPER